MTDHNPIFSKALLLSILDINYGTVIKAVIFLGLIYLPVGYIHETGHAMACNFGGGMSTIDFSFSQESTICAGPINNHFVYLLSGGLLAAFVLSLPLIFWKVLPNFIKIVLLTFAIGQGINAIVESFFYSSYINANGFWSQGFALVGMAIFLSLVFILGRNRGTEI